MKHIKLVLVAIVAIMLTACGSLPTNSRYSGANNETKGAIAGGIVGAAIFKKNPALGAVVGILVGGSAGGYVDAGQNAAGRYHCVESDGYVLTPNGERIYKGGTGNCTTTRSGIGSSRQ